MAAEIRQQPIERKRAPIVPQPYPVTTCLAGRMMTMAVPAIQDGESERDIANEDDARMPDEGQAVINSAL